MNRLSTNRSTANRSKRRLLVGSGVMLAVLLAAFLASGIALAQSSQEFDLGCRAELTAGGEWTDYSSAGVRLHSSVGQWNAGRTVVQGSGIVVLSGYILPVGQGFAAADAAAAGDAGLTEDAVVTLDDVYLPAIYATNFIRYVRPCNWPWASAVPSVD